MTTFSHLIPLERMLVDRRTMRHRHKAGAGAGAVLVVLALRHGGTLPTSIVRLSGETSRRNIIRDLREAQLQVVAVAVIVMTMAAATKWDAYHGPPPSQQDDDRFRYFWCIKCLRSELKRAAKPNARLTGVIIHCVTERNTRCERCIGLGGKCKQVSRTGF